MCYIAHGALPLPFAMPPLNQLFVCCSKSTSLSSRELPTGVIPQIARIQRSNTKELLLTSVTSRDASLYDMTHTFSAARCRLTALSALLGLV